MLVMQRLQADVPVGISWQNIKFKPQTLYKLTLVGFGKDGALVALRPASSKDPEYFALAKSWATSSAPVAKSEKPTTTVFHFDSGLKADNAFLTIRLKVAFSNP